MWADENLRGTEDSRALRRWRRPKVSNGRGGGRGREGGWEGGRNGRRKRGKLTNGWSRHVSDKINGLGARYRREQGTRAILEKEGEKGSKGGGAGVNGTEVRGRKEEME